MAARAGLARLAGFATQSPTMPIASPEQELSLVPVEPIESASANRHAWARGPGWFDSSWDLRLGCGVREGWPGDASLREWIASWFHPAGGGWSESFSAT